MTKRIMRTATFSIAFVAITLMACSSAEEPTRLPTPTGASNVKQMRLFDGQAHQTTFTMKVRFPANPALEHYSSAMASPWVRCDWSPRWERFVDGTVTPNKTVHQQMFMWINRPMGRTLTLANRYDSSEDCCSNPENDEQKVILVEYMNANIDDTIAQFKLKCPESENARDQVRQ